MRLRLLSLLALGAALGPLAAQPVQRAEIESVKDRKIEFISYVGPHAVVDTKAQIYGIGEAIGKAVAGGQAQAGSLERYGVIHAIDPSLKTGFDADIIVLGRQAGVDHIRNLRWIISGYLSSAYAYSRADADLLAEYVTIYNAVYRGNLDYFRTRYKPVVMDKLSKDNTGLALRWDEWPGRTRIVIPLGAGAGPGKLSSVDTGPLTEQKVTEKVREADDKGVETRKDMVDLKERAIEQDQAALDREKARLAAEEERRAAEREAIAAEEKALAEERARLEGGPAVKAGVEEKARDEAALAEREAALAARKEEADKAQAEADRARAEAEREQAALDAKRDEVAADRASIAADQQAAIREETSGATKDVQAPVKTGTFPEALSLSLPLARLVSLDMDKGATLKQSELNTIHARSLLELEGAYYCVAGTQDGIRAVRLTSLDAASLALKAEGKDDLFPDSPLIARDGALYAVLSKDGRYYLGKFGKDLALQAQSAEAVHPYTAITFKDEGVVVQLAQGGFAILDPAGLKSKKTLK
jgi:hypothetical protein